MRRIPPIFWYNLQLQKQFLSASAHPQIISTLSGCLTRRGAAALTRGWRRRRQTGGTLSSLAQPSSVQAIFTSVSLPPHPIPLPKMGWCGESLWIFVQFVKTAHMCVAKIKSVTPCQWMNDIRRHLTSWFIWLDITRYGLYGNILRFWWFLSDYSWYCRRYLHDNIRMHYIPFTGAPHAFISGEECRLRTAVSAARVFAWLALRLVRVRERAKQTATTFAVVVKNFKWKARTFLH